MKVIDIFYAIFVTFTWGSYFVASKILLQYFPPFLASALRFFILFLITCPYLLKNRLPLKMVFLMGVVTTLNILFINQAIHLSSKLAPVILINELAVPMSTMLGVFFFKEKFYLRDGLGMVIAFIGSAIVIQLRPTDHVSLDAIMMTIIASALFSCYNLIAKKLSKYNIFALLSLSSAFIFPNFILLSCFQESWPSGKSNLLLALIALFYIVLICSFVSHSLWFYLLKKYPISKVAPFTLLSPVFGCVITALVFNEIIENSTILGGIIVILGLTFIVTGKNNAANK